MLWLFTRTVSSVTEFVKKAHWNNYIIFKYKNQSLETNNVLIHYISADIILQKIFLITNRLLHFYLILGHRAFLSSKNFYHRILNTTCLKSMEKIWYVTKVNRNYLGRSQINEKWPPIQLLLYEVNVASSYPFQIYGWTLPRKDKVFCLLVCL